MGVTLDTVSYFTVEDITFDYNDGNPYPVNMDGIHLDGNCHYGVIRNLKGTCYDDLVALNAHEGSRGDITNITISDIRAEYCHRREKTVSQEFIRLDSGAKVGNMVLSDITCENYTDKPYAVICNKGVIDSLSTNNVYNADGPIMVNE